MTAIGVPDLAERVTVVLLAYQCAHRLAPVLRRLTALGLPLVAVDNGSNDDTEAVLRATSGVEVVRLERNLGAAGRNAGAARVRTPYVLFCDDDGWYEPDGIAAACDLLDAHPRLAVVNARIVVGAGREPDPISAIMAASPLPDRAGIPGPVLASFMAGAVLVRRSAFEQVGGYDERFFLGGEEETLAWPLRKAGWELRYFPDLVTHHWPSLANAGALRAYGMRNSLWTAWLHRPLASAVRWTGFVLADTPKNGDFVRGLTMALHGLPWVLRRRSAAAAELDGESRLLDRERFAVRRGLLNRRDWSPAGVVAERPAD